MQTDVDAPLGRDVAATGRRPIGHDRGALLATVNERDPWEGRWHERLRWGPPPTSCRGLSAVPDGTQMLATVC
jgi:hypothetical protein